MSELDELERLAALKDQGQLSDSEFQLLKETLLHSHETSGGLKSQQTSQASVGHRGLIHGVSRFRTLDKRWFVGAVVVVVVILGATAAASFATKMADGGLIADLYHGRQAAWQSGVDAGIDADLTSVYPPMLAVPDYKLTHAACFALMFGTLSPAPPGFQESAVPDLSTVQSADGWTFPTGPLAGKPVDGRVYSVTVNTTFSAAQMKPAVATSTLHVTILNGRAYEFSTCQPGAQSASISLVPVQGANVWSPAVEKIVSDGVAKSASGPVPPSTMTCVLAVIERTYPTPQDFTALGGSGIANALNSALRACPLPPTPSPAPTVAATALHLGSPARYFNGWQITAVAIEEQQPLRNVQPTIGNRLITVTIKADNTGSSGVEQVTYENFLIGGTGINRPRSAVVGTMLVPSGFVSKTLAPGASFTGTVTFEVPVGASSFILVYTDEIYRNPPRYPTTLWLLY